MIVVSGCPRSGTSLMMDIMRMSLGDGRIIGKKFPQENNREPIIREESEIRDYIEAKVKENQGNANQKKNYKDMNPNGFWECKYSVKGVQYSPNDMAIHSDNVVKIVSQGLFNTDPKYVGKIVFMLRDPRSVAKSQEKLDRGIEIPKELGKVHSPEMFINVTLQAAMWLAKNPGVPVLQVLHEDLLTDPERICLELQNFIGEGYFSKGVSVIDKKLHRSIPQDVPHDLWELADGIYELMKQKDYQGVIDFHNDTKTKPQRFMCCRLGRQVNIQECGACTSNPVVRDNFKKHISNKTRIDWKKEPCTFECLGGMTIADSIKNNSWITGRTTKAELVYQNEVLERMVEKGAKPCEIKQQRKYIEGLKG